MTSARIARARSAEPQNWLTYYGAYDGQRYSQLDQITTRNARRLGVAWQKDFAQDNPSAKKQAMEAAPIVVDGVMYVTTGGQTAVYALDARTGREIWKHETHVSDSLPLCCGWVNRGVAVAEGRVYFVTLDAKLHALDASTGREAWQTALADPQSGYSATVAPLVVKNLVLVGISGAEYGIRGFIDAYDLQTGKRRWRFNTVPGPGEPGHESWEAPDTWRTGGGASWITGAYDPDLNLVYWGVANPGPDLNGSVRPGDNLYTNSVVALNPDDGSLKWHFQTTPHDLWDYDNYENVLADVPVNGQTVKALLVAPKNGYLYTLDRATGKFISARPYARVTWATGIDSVTGRPHVNPQAIPGPAYVPVCPSFDGAKSWNHMAYSPGTHMVYIPINENCHEFRSSQPYYVRGEPFVAGDVNKKYGGPAEEYGAMRAVDVATGRQMWQIKSKYPVVTSALTTAGGLVVWAEAQGVVHATDARTGRDVWTYKAPIGAHGNPITYAVDGEQYVAIPLGISGPALSEYKAFLPKGHQLLVFKLSR
ncbi:MAG: PQQ-dependent dehydrogenase, methanol/ethanol family [Candidatus Eremiobacteraeota bacterium]|nr:PQQ-dependent dehydrogenase, methanol/ethanol family [Candidatus Eremiobacteraeota bacterium]